MLDHQHHREARCCRAHDTASEDLTPSSLDPIVAAGPLKVVADGTSLPFLDRTFGTAKAFFFLMYVLDADREAVFAEAFRVLKPGGRFYVWDVTIPDKGDRPQRGFAVFVKAELSDRTIETGYGVSWEGKEMSAGTIGELAKRAGFYLIEAGKPSEKTFRLAFRRPDS